LLHDLATVLRHRGISPPKRKSRVQGPWTSARRSSPSPRRWTAPSTLSRRN